MELIGINFSVVVAFNGKLELGHVRIVSISLHLNYSTLGREFKNHVDSWLLILDMQIYFRDCLMSSHVLLLLI